MLRIRTFIISYANCTPFDTCRLPSIDYYSPNRSVAVANADADAEMLMLMLFAVTFHINYNNLILVVSVADARMTHSLTIAPLSAAGAVDAAGVRHPHHWDSYSPAALPSCCRSWAYRRWHLDPASRDHHRRHHH